MVNIWQYNNYMYLSLEFNTVLTYAYALGMVLMAALN